MEYSNHEVAKILRNVAASYRIKKFGNIFQVRAYENAADSIEHSTADISDLWKDDKLHDIPGLGERIQAYLEELFSTGKVSHFEDVEKGIPDIVFKLLDVPGIGPQTAQKIAELGVDSLDQLRKELKDGKLVKKGFSEKIGRKILNGLEEISRRDNRMLLPYASSLAETILCYLKASPDVYQADPLGSLRRRVATIGDIDFAVSSDNPKAVVDYFVKMPQIAQIYDQGENKASVLLKNGIRVDLLVGDPKSYGALLQHFTGSKAHNIKLRIFAERGGFSLSEKIQCKKEEDVYNLLNMQTPPPEMREDIGEIETALQHKLPKLIELKDIKGDLHTHSNHPFPHPSHGPGVNPISEIVKKSQDLGYDFIGIADHPPGFTSVSREQLIKSIKERTRLIHYLNMNTHSIRVLNGLEIDILSDGSLSVPDEALATLDYCIAGIHSGHRGSKELMTQRLLKALNNPHVDIIAHPTNRLLDRRGSSDLDWDKIFRFCAKNNKLLEINAFPDRLDLRDDLVRRAKAFGVMFIINTDAHEISQMDNMQFGVSVARRGWAEKKDIVNTWDWKKLTGWFNINK